MIYLYTFRPNHFHTAERLAQTFQFKDAVSGNYVSKRAIFARRNQIFIAARTIYYLYRGHNKNCLCGINLLFVLRYALPVVFSEREMACPSRLNFASNDYKPCGKIDRFANRGLFLLIPYFPSAWPLAWQNSQREGRPHISECTQWIDY